MYTITFSPLLWLQVMPTALTWRCRNRRNCQSWQTRRTSLRQPGSRTGRKRLESLMRTGRVHQTRTPWMGLRGERVPVGRGQPGWGPAWWGRCPLSGGLAGEGGPCPSSGVVREWGSLAGVGRHCRQRDQHQRGLRQNPGGIEWIGVNHRK